MTCPRDRLLEALESGRVVVVTGAGVSAAVTDNAEASTWIGLIRSGIRKAQKIDPDKASALELNLDEWDDVESLAFIANKLRTILAESYSEWLTEEIRGLEVKSKEVVEAIGELGVPILTTNYDLLAESILGRPSTSYSDPNGMREVVMGESNAIAHLHGSVSDPNEIVLTGVDYSKIVSDRGAQLLQKSAFAASTFLFIGTGAGASDANFSPMIDEFENVFGATSDAHFRLCLDKERAQHTDGSSIVDVPYGTCYSDLAPFIRELAQNLSATKMQLKRRSSAHLRQELSSLFNGAGDRVMDRLRSDPRSVIVKPLFDSEPVERRIAEILDGGDRAAISGRSEVDLAELLASDRPILIVGDHHSGVSTAVWYCLNELVDRGICDHAIFLDGVTRKGKPRVSARLRGYYEQWAPGDPSSCRERAVVGLDDIDTSNGGRVDRLRRDLPVVKGKKLVLGTHLEFLAEVETLVRGVLATEVDTVYLGKFGKSEAVQLAENFGYVDPQGVAARTMKVVSKYHLPRTPDTISMLIEIDANSSTERSVRSTDDVIVSFIETLLDPSGARYSDNSSMTLRQKLNVLGAMAKALLYERKSRMSESEFVALVEREFRLLGLKYSAVDCLQDLTTSRVLKRDSQGVEFSRSVFFTEIVGIEAAKDLELRGELLRNPTELSEFVATYGAHSRRDDEFLDELCATLSGGRPGSLGSGIFSNRILGASVADSVAEEVASSADVRERADDEEIDGEFRDMGRVLDSLADLDPPVYHLVTDLEGCADWQVELWLLSAASQMLRDADELRDQAKKGEFAIALLEVWVRFCESFEMWVTENDEVGGWFSQAGNFLLGEVAIENRTLRRELDQKLTAIEVLLASLLSNYFSGESLSELLGTLDLDGRANRPSLEVLRVVSCMFSGSRQWVSTLRTLSVKAKELFFSQTFLYQMASAWYLLDDSMLKDDRVAVADFLHEVAAYRAGATRPAERSRVFNSVDESLRSAKSWIVAEGRRLPSLEVVFG